jgi:hypothetical protein
MKRNIFITVLISSFFVLLSQQVVKKKTKKRMQNLQSFWNRWSCWTRTSMHDSEETSFRSKFAGKEISCQ